MSNDFAFEVISSRGEGIGGRHSKNTSDRIYVRDGSGGVEWGCAMLLIEKQCSPRANEKWCGIWLVDPS